MQRLILFFLVSVWLFQRSRSIKGLPIDFSWECLHDTDYINGWDGHMDAQEAGYWIAGQQSTHNDDKEDRRFMWDYCRPDDPNTDYNHNDAVTTLSKTGYDNGWYRECANDAGHAAISRIKSWHDSGKEDRKYEIYCKTLQPQFDLIDCDWTGWRNGYDKFLNYQCSDGIMKGIHSVHDNGKEDRKYDFLCCGMTLTPMDLSTNFDDERLLTRIKSTYSADTNNRDTISFEWGKPVWFLNSDNVVKDIYFLTDTQPDTYYWSRVCPTNGAISEMTVTDDSFEFTCGILNDLLKITRCEWTEYVNQFELDFDVNCPEDGPIRGVESYYSEALDDRKFKVYCCVIARGEYSKNHDINIALQIHSGTGADTEAILTLDLCWNNDEYQAIIEPNAVDTWFSVAEVVKYGECGNDRDLIVSMVSDSDDPAVITAVEIEDGGRKYIASSFKDCLSITVTKEECASSTANGEFSVSNAIPDVVIRFPDDYVTSCLDPGCDAEVYNLDGFQQYLITIIACGSFNMEAGLGDTEIGVLLRGTSGNLDKKILTHLTGSDFIELPVGEGNVGELVHVSIEYESGPDYCIEQVTVLDPYNGDIVFKKDHFGDGTIISGNCELNDFQLLSGIQYIPCYDTPFGMKTYGTSLYASIQIHACSGAEGGIQAANSALLSMTITGTTLNDKFINTRAYALKSTTDWAAGDSRDFTLPISGEFDKISLVSISNNDATEALCVDSVLINNIDAFLTHYWVGFTAEHNSLQTIPAVLEWPICGVELTTIIQAESPLPVDPDTVATSTCVNSNRLLYVGCEISQDFETYQEISWEHETGEEISSEVAMESGTEVGASIEISAGYQKGPDASQLSFGISAGASFAFSSSMSRTNGKTKLDVTTDGKVDGKTIGISCTGSVSVPPNQQVQYSMLIEQAAAELTTLTDIKMTKCSAFLYPDSYADPNNYVYIYGIEGKLHVKEATNCYVSFSQSTQVSSDGITCGKERALAAREWGTFVPLCDEDDYDKYQKCQCAYGDSLTLPTCGCVDETTGNLLDTASAAVVAETPQYSWRDWCDENCGGGKKNAFTPIFDGEFNFNKNIGLILSLFAVVLSLLAVVVAVTYIVNSCVMCWKKNKKDDGAYHAVCTVDTEQENII